MDNSSDILDPLNSLISTGFDGLVALLIWNLTQTNKTLLAEIKERDKILTDIILNLLNNNERRGD
ncbi:MAG: hypothetical protein WBA13_18170 [Microcoleaceae cyanobacterium]